MNKTLHKVIHLNSKLDRYDFSDGSPALCTKRIKAWMTCLPKKIKVYVSKERLTHKKGEFLTRVVNRFGPWVEISSGIYPIYSTAYKYLNEYGIYSKDVFWLKLSRVRKKRKAI